MVVGLNLHPDRRVLRQFGLLIMRMTVLLVLGVDNQAGEHVGNCMCYDIDIPAREAERRLGRRLDRPRLGYRDVASPSNRLTLIAAVLPAGAEPDAADRSATLLDYLALANGSRVVVSEPDEVVTQAVGLASQIARSHEQTREGGADGLLHGGVRREVEAGRGTLRVDVVEVDRGRHEAVVDGLHCGEGTHGAGAAEEVAGHGLHAADME